MKKSLLIAIKLLIAVGLFWAILAATDWQTLVDKAAGFSPLTFIGLMAVVLAQAALLGLRWSIIARQTGHDLPFWDGVAGTLTSFFFSQGLPSSIGGDALRIWWMKRRNVPLGDSTLCVLFDRVIGLLSLLVVCIVSLLLLGSRTEQPTFAALSNGVAACIVIGLGAAMVAIVPRRMGLSRRLLESVERLPAWAAELARWAVKFREMFIGLSAHPPAAVTIALLGIVVHVMTVLIGYLVTLELGTAISFADCLAVIAPALLISYLPISIAGWGVREASIVGAFSLISVPTDTALLVSLVIGFSVLAASLVGGGIWMLGGVREAYRLSSKTAATPGPAG